MNQPQKPTQVQILQAQLQSMAKLLTAMILKFGTEQIIYVEGKAPGIEVALSAEEFNFDYNQEAGTYHCEQIPDGKGGLALRLSKVVPQ